MRARKADKDVFRELKIKMELLKHKTMITELTSKLVRCNGELTLSILLNQIQEAELLKYKIMEAGYSEGE